MAEAIVNAGRAPGWQAFSAGTRPAGHVHPMATQVLAELGIAHQGASKRIEDLPRLDFDLVVTVCNEAAEECPIWLGKGKRIHLGYPDPASATGTESERLAVFRQVRDDMLRQIPPLLAEVE